MENVFREVLKAKAHDLRVEDESVVMAVPYIPIPPTLEKNTWHFDSVASDFDAAETWGMALAVKDFVGGSVEDHFRNLFIVCGVHRHRMFQRRSREDKARARSRGMRDFQQMDCYTRLVTVRSEDGASDVLDQILLFDPDWIQWLQHSKMLPMVCPVFSGMSEVVRAMGYSDTNVCESHSRKGNFYVEKVSSPEEAVCRLAEVDKIDEHQLKDGHSSNPGNTRLPRVRRYHTLAPSRSRSQAARTKRSASDPGRGTGTKRRRVMGSGHGGRIQNADGTAQHVVPPGSFPQQKLSVDGQLLAIMREINKDPSPTAQTKSMANKALGDLYKKLMKRSDKTDDAAKSLIMDQVLELGTGHATYLSEKLLDLLQQCSSESTGPPLEATCAREDSTAIPTEEKGNDL